MRLTHFYLLALLTGCAEKAVEKPKETPPPLPRITHFYGTQPVVAAGDSLTICYGTENVTTVTMQPYDDTGLGPALNRCVAHVPGKNTTYTLTAKGPGGETTATFSVRVGAVAAKEDAKEKALIQNFQILGNMPVAPGARVQLCYSTDAANAVSVQPQVQASLSGGKNRCFVVTPPKTTTYVLTATAPGGAVDRMQVTVAVQ